MAGVKLTAKVLEDAARRNNFPVPDGELVFFGIRGASPENPGNQQFAKSHDLRFTEVDYLNMRCTIGQWNRKANTIAVFPGSTVPNAAMIASAKSKGGAGANRLLPGRYEHEKGIHKRGKPGAHRAFRQASFFPVQRNSNDQVFDQLDRIDFGKDKGDFVWDNLHSAFHDDPDGRFSSAGCQVVCGLPQRAGARETGPWRAFIDSAYGDFDQQDRFAYLLFTADEIGVAANNDDTGIRQVVKYGSTGALAKKVQEALVAAGDLEGEPDGKFGRKSLMALVAFQERKFGASAVDAVCGPNTAAALGITLPTLTSAKLEGKPEPDHDQADNEGEDHPDDTDFAPSELEAILAALGISGGKVVKPPVGDMRPVFDYETFFRAVDKSLFFRPLSESQRNGTRDVIDYWLKHFPKGDRRWLAYILATVYHETGELMVPVREGFKKTDAEARQHVRNMFIRGRISQDYAKPVNGVSYFGRGRVQNTFFDNYRKLARRFGKDFVNEPSLLLDSRTDAEVTVVGHVEGLWTKFQLSDFIKGEKCDYFHARQIVNKLDKASKIEAHAKAFERAIALSFTARPKTDEAPAVAEVAENQQGEPEMAKIDAETDAKIDRILDALAAMMGKDTPTDGEESAGGIDEERLAAIKEAVAKLGGGGDSGLTPVNGALGETIGKLLNGRKSAIGIIGALLTSILGQTGDGSILGKLVNAVVTAIPALSGLSGPLLPIFIAMAVWGVLGKQEKWMFKKDKKKTG